MNDLLRQRALDEALANPERHLERLRQKQRALARHVERASRRKTIGFPVGVLGVTGGATLAGLTLATAIATPIGWLAAAAAGVTGLFSLALSSSAGRREATARDHQRRMHLSHEGRALEVDALISRMEIARNAMAADYARLEAAALRQVDAARHAANAAFLQSLRSRHLSWVRRLDAARDAAIELRRRLIVAAITEQVDARLGGLAKPREAYEDRLARTHFEVGDAKAELEHLTLETDALEALEREYAAVAI